MSGWKGKNLASSIFLFSFPHAAHLPVSVYLFSLSSAPILDGRSGSYPRRYSWAVGEGCMEPAGQRKCLVRSNSLSCVLADPSFGQTSGPFTQQFTELEEAMCSSHGLYHHLHCSRRIKLDQLPHAVLILFV